VAEPAGVPLACGLGETVETVEAVATGLGTPGVAVVVAVSVEAGVLVEVGVSVTTGVHLSSTSTRYLPEA